MPGSPLFTPEGQTLDLGLLERGIEGNSVERRLLPPSFSQLLERKSPFSQAF